PSTQTRVVKLQKSVLGLLAPYPKPHPSAEIDRQSRVSHHLVIPPVQPILHVRIERQSRPYRVPSPEIDAHISRRVFNSKAQKIRVRTLSHKASRQTSSPPRPQI